MDHRSRPEASAAANSLKANSTEAVVPVTQVGRATAQALAAARDRLFERLLGSWSAEDRQALTRLNSALAAAMKRLSQSHDDRG